MNEKDFMGAAAGMSLGTCGLVTISVHTCGVFSVIQTTSKSYC